MRWQVKAVRSCRIGIWRRNRHRTMRLISASVGDQNGTSHGLLWEAAHAAAVRPTRLGHPLFLDAVGAQTADFNEVRSPKNLAILGLMRLNFLSVRAGQVKPGLVVLGYGLVKQCALGLARVVEFGFAVGLCCGGVHRAMPARSLSGFPVFPLSLSTWTIASSK